VQRGRGGARVPAGPARHVGPRPGAGDKRGQRVRVRTAGRASDGLVRRHKGTT